MSGLLVYSKVILLGFQALTHVLTIAFLFKIDLYYKVNHSVE
ncbi:hypothetical protein [Clostridium perfringens]